MVDFLCRHILVTNIGISKARSRQRTVRCGTYSVHWLTRAGAMMTGPGSYALGAESCTRVRTDRHARATQAPELHRDTSIARALAGCRAQINSPTQADILVGLHGLGLHAVTLVWTRAHSGYHILPRGRLHTIAHWYVFLLWCIALSNSPNNLNSLLPKRSRKI